MRRFQRKRLFVDVNVQGALLLRIVAYWFLSLITVSLLLVCLEIVNGKAVPIGDYFNFTIVWEEHISVLLAMLTILPIILLDTLVLSNRFAGPFYRIRRAIHALASGDPVEPLQFRSNDYWRDVAKDLNSLGEQMRQANEQPSATPPRQDASAKGELELEPATAGH